MFPAFPENIFGRHDLSRQIYIIFGVMLLWKWLAIIVLVDTMSYFLRHDTFFISCRHRILTSSHYCNIGSWLPGVKQNFSFWYILSKHARPQTVHFYSRNAWYKCKNNIQCLQTININVFVGFYEHLESLNLDWFI